MQKISVLVVLLCAVTATSAQSDHAVAPMSLFDVWRLALANNEAVHIADAEFAASTAGNSKLNRYLPNVNLSGNYTNSQLGDNDAVNNNAITLSVEQNIPLPGTRDMAKSAQRQALDTQAALTRADTLSTIIVDTIEQYFAVLRAQNELTFARAAVDAAAYAQTRAQTLFDAGEAVAADVAQAKAAYDIANARLIDAENTVKRYYLILSQAIHADVQSISDINDAFVPAPLADDVSVWLAQMRQNNTAIQAAAATIEAQRATLTAVRSNRKPELYAFANMTHSDDATFSGPSRSAGVRVNWPIYSGGDISADSKVAAAGLRIAQLNYDRLMTSATHNIRILFDASQTNRRLYDAYAQSVLSAQSAVDAAETAFSLGSATVQDVQDRLTELAAARRDRRNAAYDTMLADIKLLAATHSVLTPDVVLAADIAPPSLLNPPDVH